MNPEFLAELSWWAYPESLETSTDKEWSQAVIKKLAARGWTAATYALNGNEVLSAYNEQDLCIAFRGTTDGFDWLTNGLVVDPLHRRMPSAGLHAHTGHCGYVRSLEAVWEHCAQLLQNHRNKKLHWTGHSKGGALASLACLRALSEGFASHSCYTFGEPANASRGLVRWSKQFNHLDRRRYVRCQDIVPRCPMWMQWTGRLKHWGKHYYFDRNMELRINHSQAWVAWDVGRSVTQQWLQCVEHHYMNGYVSLVKQNW